MDGAWSSFPFCGVEEMDASTMNATPEMRVGRPAAFGAAVRATTAVVWAALAFAAFAQSEFSGVFKRGEQVKALAAGLERVPDDARKLVALSRLLSEPEDQVTWLLERAEALSKGGKADAAAAVAEAALARIDRWMPVAPGVVGLRERAEKLKKTEVASGGNSSGGNSGAGGNTGGGGAGGGNTGGGDGPPETIIDPAQLAAWLNSPQSRNARLTPEVRSVLWSRGVPFKRLSTSAGAARGVTWEFAAGLVLDLGLAERMTLTKLLSSSARLASPPGGDLLNTASFQIARGLCNLAAGGPGTGGNWGSMAASLEQQNYWAWAALALVLDAAERPLAERGAIIERIRELTARVKVVEGGSDERLISKALEKWIPRLSADSGPSARDSIVSFDPSWRTTRVQSRDSKAQQAADALRAGNVEQGFKLIQEAKLAEMGVTSARTITIAELQSRLMDGRVAGVHAFIELLESGGQYYAVVIGADGPLGNPNTKWITPAVVSGKNSFSDLLGEAVQKVGGGERISGARIIVAPDGAARTAEWATSNFGGLRALLTKDDRQYIALISSAAVLQRDSSWTPEFSVRYFYEAARGSFEVDGTPADGPLNTRVVFIAPGGNLTKPANSPFRTLSALHGEGKSLGTLSVIVGVKR